VLQGQIEEFEFKINLPDKNSRILHTVLIPCDNKQDGFYGLSTDITELKLLQSHLEYEANHDVLTGLPNRRAFLRDLSEATMDLEKSMEGMAVLFMDIDDFKFYNDSYGHEFGDLVLKTFARMLKKSILEKNSVARLAGDEFTIILTRLADPEKEVKTIVEKIATELKNIEKIAGVNLRLSASIGIGIAHAKEKILPHTLLTKADNAMYQAKMSGKGMHAIN
jgi:diguanylate cyclase (GGDEF)-like protein